jgi:hypothetical protein
MTKGDNVTATAAVKMYEKTSNGITYNIPLEEGEWILSHYRGDGSRFVKSLTQTSSGTYEIALKRGEKIRLVELDDRSPRCGSAT